MEIQALVNVAWELKQKGNLRGALACYSDAFDMLLSAAHSYARSTQDAVVDIGKVRAATSVLFDEVKKYLKCDNTAAVISNNMGAIFVEIGDYSEAQKMFEQAIDLTPNNEEYIDPKRGLHELKNH